MDKYLYDENSRLWYELQREASPSHLIKPGEAEGEGIREQQKAEKVLERTGRPDFKER